MNHELFDLWHKKIYLVNMTKELNQTFSELFKKGISKYLGENKKSKSSWITSQDYQI